MNCGVQFSSGIAKRVEGGRAMSFHLLIETKRPCGFRKISMRHFAKVGSGSWEIRLRLKSSPQASRLKTVRQRQIASIVQVTDVVLF